MAGTSLLTLLDDIATTLDDVAILTKVAAKKTAGVLGDDLALNAEQVAGVNADRELPVVWAVAKGSTLNKLILIPLALAISQVSTTLVVALLLLGGIYLCFEGFEKVFHKFFHPKPASSIDTHAADKDIAAYEKDKIKGAIRTDFILSAEIIVITLGTVASQPFLQQVMVLSGIAAAMTIGVYGFVAIIVKLDDLGLYFLKKPPPAPLLGKGLLLTAPLLMKFLGIAGTLAMFLVGGGIVSHNIPPIHHSLEGLSWPLAIGADLFLGICSGAIVLLGITLLKKLKRK